MNRNTINNLHLKPHHWNGPVALRCQGVQWNSARRRKHRTANRCADRLEQYLVTLNQRHRLLDKAERASDYACVAVLIFATLYFGGHLTKRGATYFLLASYGLITENQDDSFTSPSFLCSNLLIYQRFKLPNFVFN
jgi:hypothetical protein